MCDILVSVAATKPQRLRTMRSSQIYLTVQRETQKLFRFLDDLLKYRQVGMKKNQVEKNIKRVLTIDEAEKLHQQILKTVKWDFGPKQSSVQKKAG
jgi:hypothetical protein